MKRKNMVDLSDVKLAKQKLQSALPKLRGRGLKKRYECVRIALHILDFEFKDKDFNEAA